MKKYFILLLLILFFNFGVYSIVLAVMANPNPIDLEQPDGTKITIKLNGDEFYNWFSKGVILFGLLSGRFEDNEQDSMIDALDNLGGFDEYEKLKNILVETEDRAVIEALIANKSLM